MNVNYKFNITVTAFCVFPPTPFHATPFFWGLTTILSLVLLIHAFVIFMQCLCTEVILFCMLCNNMYFTTT